MQRNDIFEGLRDGTPIALGYFAVAFSLGIIAGGAGLTAVAGFVSSFFTRASAGEYGVYTLMAASAPYTEIVVMCLVTNLRYMLMGAALSQKIAPDTSRLHRLLMACCITDEVFGISIAHRGYTPPAYTYSAALISTVFWASGAVDASVGVMSVAGASVTAGAAVVAGAVSVSVADGTAEPLHAASAAHNSSANARVMVFFIRYSP